MLLFTLINLVGAKLLSDSNSVIVIWKTAIPVLTVVVLVTLSFHAVQLPRRRRLRAASAATASSPRCRPAWCSRCRASSSAVQLAGEARDPQRDISRAVITAMLVGRPIYILLRDLLHRRTGRRPTSLHGWAAPIGEGNYGPYTTWRSRSAPAGWPRMLMIDAVISPAGTGLVYVGDLVATDLRPR